MTAVTERGVLVFFGIRYAKPPVGLLRWRAPQPLSARTTPFEATRFGAICPQAGPRGDAGVGVEAQSEDCLGGRALRTANESIDPYGQRLASDALFRVPALRLAWLRAAGGTPAWTYEFDVLATAANARLNGAPHASERAYVFDSLPMLGWPTDTEDAALARDLGSRWVAFAQGDAPVWPAARRNAARPFRFARTGAEPQPPLTPALERYFGL